MYISMHVRTSRELCLRSHHSSMSYSVSTHQLSQHIQNCEGIPKTPSSPCTDTLASCCFAQVLHAEARIFMYDDFLSAGERLQGSSRV